MTAGDLKLIQDKWPEELRVWYDGVLQLSKEQLVETLLVHMTTRSLISTLSNIRRNTKENHDEDTGSTDPA